MQLYYQHFYGLKTENGIIQTTDLMQTSTLKHARNSTEIIHKGVTDSRNSWKKYDIRGKCGALISESRRSGGSVQQWPTPACCQTRGPHWEQAWETELPEASSPTVWGGSTLFHRNGFMEMGVNWSAGKPLIGNLRCDDTCRPKPVLHEREVTARPNHGRDMTRCRLPPPC